MFSIKTSFADCLSCPLFSKPSCILESNTKNIEDVDIVFITENPRKGEAKQGKPLVGKEGKLFRKYFEKYNLNSLNYILTSVVLCQTLNDDGTTGNPDKEVIEKCKINCMKIIEHAKPKLIVLLGTSTLAAFELLPKNTGIANIRGTILNWKGYETFVLLHPSYVNQNKNMESLFENDIKVIAEKFNLLDKNIKQPTRNHPITAKKGKSFYYKIPDKYYTSDYKLIDIQFLKKSNEVLYIFRDKDNKKEYYKTNDDYICYQILDKTKNRKIVPYEELQQIKVPYAQKYSLDPDITYEGDLKITNKHAIDYYLTKKEDEANVPLNILFLDIETYSETKANSGPYEAKDTIAMIRYTFGKINKTLVIDPKVLKIQNQTINQQNGIVICNSEETLLNTFLNDMRNLDPDVVTGWYSNDFDMQYIFHRCANLNIDATKMSRFGEAEFNKYQFYPDAAGIVFLDMLELYKKFTFGVKESYSLNFISKLELKKEKTDKGSNFSNLFRQDVNKAIEYNKTDVDLLVELDEKLQHIYFQDELKKICKSTFRGSNAVLGQVDSLLVSFLKENGVSSKNTNVTDTNDRFTGAYVQKPIVGLHEYLVDFDFTSLYPSIILTYNIGVNTFVMKLEDSTLGYELVYDQNSLPENLNVIIDPFFLNQKMTITKKQLLDKIKQEDLIYTINGCFYKNHKKETSFYVKILEMLLYSRKLNKNKMFEAMNQKNKSDERLYKSRQLIYKTIANSIYGALGNKVFRFFNVDSAYAITSSGQEAIKNVMLSSEDYINSKIKNTNPNVKFIDKKQMFSDEMNVDFKHLITGDTDSVFLCYDKVLQKYKIEKDNILDYVNSLNVDVQKFLNEDVIQKIIEKHRVSLEKNRLELKNELVIKKGLFLAKKRYANYIIMKEGNPVDVIESMGLETKRSDYSNLTKDGLKELLKLILKSDNFSFDEIMGFVKNQEQQFLNILKRRDTTIGRPVSFAKNLEEYKVLPQGVRGMIAWNQLEYQVFVTGSRGYLFKLKGINLEIAPDDVRKKYDEHFLKNGQKLDVLVVPEEQTTVPEYYIIDIKEMINFAWTDRYNLLLAPFCKNKNEILTF